MIKLTRPDLDLYFYTGILPDGRRLEVGKVAVNKFRHTKSNGLFVRASTAWAIDIIDDQTRTKASTEGFASRRAAVDAALKWAAQNPREIVA